MALRNIRPLHVLWQITPDVNTLNGIYLGIWQILSMAGVTKEVEVKLLNQRRQSDWLNQNGGLKRYRSLDWHIELARRNSKKAGHLHGVAMLFSLGKDPAYKAEPAYEVVVVNEPLHWHEASQRTIAGISLTNQSTIISLHDYLPFLRPVNGESSQDAKKRLSSFRLATRMITVHELGHVFGLFPGTTNQNPNDRELTESHCPNECAMYCWANDDLVQKIKDRPLCPSCLEKLKQWFVEP